MCLWYVLSALLVKSFHRRKNKTNKKQQPNFLHEEFPFGTKSTQKNKRETLINSKRLARTLPPNSCQTSAFISLTFKYAVLGLLTGSTNLNLFQTKAIWVISLAQPMTSLLKRKKSKVILNKGFSSHWKWHNPFQPCWQEQQIPDHSVRTRTAWRWWCWGQWERLGGPEESSGWCTSPSGHPEWWCHSKSKARENSSKINSGF